MLQITDKGIVIERLDEVHNRLVNNFKSIYGQDINVDADTPDGQMIGIFSQSIADINEVISFVVQMLDPYQATGPWLEQRVLYAGITRKGAEYSYIEEVAIIGDRVVTIPKGSILIDSNKTRWVTLDEVTTDVNGSARVSLRSEELGAFNLGENEELKFETVTVGVKKATTTQAAEAGKEEEVDPVLQRRFMMSHSINNNDDRQGIQAALNDLPDVKKALVLENYEGTPDEERGLPRNSMNAIVVGGADEDIALVLLKKKKGGPAFVGETELSIFYKDANRLVRFDRATKLTITVELTLKRLQGFTDVNETEIKESLMGKDFNIAEDVYAFDLICSVNQQNGFTVKTISINGADHVEVGWREYALIESVEVTIE